MSPSSAPSDVNESRAKIVHAVHSVIKILDTLCSLGREELEREGGFVLLVSQLELLRDMHFVVLSLAGNECVRVKYGSDRRRMRIERK
jgi:hypothetical protein